MTIEECYRSFGGDFNGVSARIPSPALIKRLLKKFLADPSMADLRAASSNGDAEIALRSAHTLKGLALNMGFTDLGEKASQLTEQLRGRDLTGTQAMLATVDEAYHRVADALSQLDD